MKTYKIILFIVGVFGLLSIIGLLMPEEGIEIGSEEVNGVKKPVVNVKFVNPKEMIFGGSTDSVPHYVPSSNKELNIDSMTVAQMDSVSKAKYAVITAHNAIVFPNNDPAWMDPVFEMLRMAHRYPIRIIHYGDSQIEIDRMTSELRHQLQSEFGGFGAGMLPAIQTVTTTAIRQDCNKDMTRYIVYAPNQKLKTKQYGPMGQTAVLQGNATFTFQKQQMKSTKNGTKRFGQIGILYEPHNDDHGKEGILATGVIKAGDKEYPFALKDGSTFCCIDLPDSTAKATVTLNGHALIHGFLLDGNGVGVNVDNVPMRGCSGTVFTQIAQSSLETYFSRFNVPLIIMQYGGNAMPCLKPGKSAHEFCNGLRRQFRLFKRISPNSRILFIGPSDMSTTINGKLQTYPSLPIVVDSIRTVCLENNVAFWDLYTAMGGWNSMLKWVHANPQLAGGDYIHFTTIGAEHVGKMLTNSIFQAYRYYLLRTPNAGDARNLKQYEIDSFSGTDYPDGILYRDQSNDCTAIGDSASTVNGNEPGERFDRDSRVHDSISVGSPL